MNKKMNTILFLLGATVFNVLAALLSFIILMILYANFILEMIPGSGQEWGFTIIFILSIGISFLTYRAVIKFLIKKIDIEKYFDPIFVRKYKKPPPKT